MKIAINKCYGGFGLSHKAIMRYAEIKGIKIYPAKEIISGVRHTGKFLPWDGSNADIMTYYLTKPLDELNNPDDVYGAIFSIYDFERNDPALIQVIEELGEDANSNYSELSIVEIPDGISWEIEEYDGQEWVSETHRTWG